MNVKHLYDFVQSKPALRQLFANKAVEHISCLLGNEVESNSTSAIVRRRGSVKRQRNGESQADRVLEFIKNHNGVTSKDIFAHFDFRKNAVHRAVWQLKKEGLIKSKKNGKSPIYFAR